MQPGPGASRSYRSALVATVTHLHGESSNLVAIEVDENGEVLHHLCFPDISY